MFASAVLDADASRLRGGILKPSSDGSLNHPTGSISPDERTGKRAGPTAMDHLLNSVITIKPHPPNIQVQPRTLLPLMVLPRKHLPLSSLDLVSPASGFSQSRFVESHIKILDLESRLGSAHAVVIARNDSTGTAYALERQDDGLYAMCKLGSWVDLLNLAKYSTALCRSRLTFREQNQREAKSDSTLTVPNLHRELKKKRAAIEAIQSLVRKKSKPQPSLEAGVKWPEGHGSALNSEIKSDGTIAADCQPNDGNVLAVNNSAKEMSFSSQQTAESILNNIRTQYFDTLYKSMGSLAYFAKGPLSRARSAFYLDPESSLEMKDLTDFLKSLVLTTVQIDKKYRETIPDIIAKMKTFADSSDECGKKRRKPKKMKLGKDALYPREDESIRKWWNANKPELTSDDNAIPEPHVKSHISMLRTRETQLQMILILEILALEPLSGACQALSFNLPKLSGAESQPFESNLAAATKRRNKHNLPLLVDVHADRLTIWQSTASDEQLLLGDAQPTQASADGSLQQKPSSEPLKDFCVDVVVPFFSARLPELCDAISRKLGGPIIISPNISKSLTRSSGKREQKPGAVKKRRLPASPNVRRTLQRALSTEQMHRRSVSRGPSNAIALMRSATSTTLSGVKREGSEPLSLKEIAMAEAPTGRLRQSSLSRSNSTSNMRDIKASKQALVDAELKDAISALRKPNREVIGKAMAEADERRATTSQSAKKGRRISRSSLASHIQVKATPANNRFKDVLTARPEASLENKPLEGTEDAIPPSSVGYVVPSTGHRRVCRDALVDSISPAVDYSDETPVRSSVQHGFLRRLVQDESGFPPSSPLINIKTASSDDYGVSRSIDNTSVSSRPVLSHSQNILATPVKKGVSRLDLIQTPLSACDANQLNKASIYDKLGWDDDFDDL